jgi:carnitine 3-dehydrogenase
MSGDGPLRLLRAAVMPSWLDYNGHMTESRYLYACSETTDAFLRLIGADHAHVASGFSYYTVETHLVHIAEAKLGDRLTGSLQVLGAEPKRLHVFVRIERDGSLLATLEQMLLHVDMAAGRAVPAPAAILAKVQPIATAHARLPRPSQVGRSIGLRP